MQCDRPDRYQTHYLSDAHEMRPYSGLIYHGPRLPKSKSIHMKRGAEATKRLPRMSALGQKQTYGLQKATSALPPIATAKADIRWWISEANACKALS